jgi:hypothetical protein
MNELRTFLIALAVLGLAACESGAGQTKAQPTEPTPVGTSAPTAKAGGGDVKAPAAPATPKAPAVAENYTIAGAAPALTVGTAGELTIDVKPKPGYKINLEFPWKAKIVGGDNFTVEPQVGKDKWTLDKASASLKTPVTAKAAGDGTVTAKVSFSVCNDNACDVIRDREVAVKVAAK